MGKNGLRNGDYSADGGIFHYGYSVLYAHPDPKKKKTSGARVGPEDGEKVLTNVIPFASLSVKRKKTRGSQRRRCKGIGVTSIDVNYKQNS